MSGSATTAREALLGELLREIDKAIERLEAVDASLAAKVEAATRGAVGQALLGTRLNFESLIGKQEVRLLQAGGLLQL